MHPGLKSQLFGSICDAAGDKVVLNSRSVFINMDEESLEEHMERVKGFSLNQVERMYLLTTSPLELTESKRLHYQGKNRGNSLFPVKAPSWSGDEM